MIKFNETTYLPDGTTKEKSEMYSINKSRLIKLLKKKTAVPTEALYDLSKFNESFFEMAGLKHKLVIENSDSKEE